MPVHQSKLRQACSTQSRKRDFQQEALDIEGRPDRQRILEARLTVLEDEVRQMKQAGPVAQQRGR